MKKQITFLLMVLLLGICCKPVCTHIHDEDCGPNGENCTHICTENNPYRFEEPDL